MTKVRYIRNLFKVSQLNASLMPLLNTVAQKYAFRANDYYLSLIKWDDPDDPIRKIVIPDPAELEPWGPLDVSNEVTNYVAEGCQHKYCDTALLLVNEVCGSYCRFCFRKRLFMHGNDEVVHDIRPGLEYIRSNPQITNVLVTGGDPLIFSTRKIEAIIRSLWEIPHVGIIRIGTKMPAFNPYRIIDDPELLEVLARYSTRHKRIYFMLHFNHPRELTDAAHLAIDLLQRAGVILCNQSPIVRGINDDPDVLAELMRELSFIGVPPYYFFQCRPTAGNKPFEMPLVETYHVFEMAKSQVSGLAKRARLVMSHASGKIEVVGVTEEKIYLRYHRAHDPQDVSRFMEFERDDAAYWLDDLMEAEEVGEISPAEAEQDPYSYSPGVFEGNYPDLN